MVTKEMRQAPTSGLGSQKEVARIDGHKEDEDQERCCHVRQEVPRKG